MRTLAAVAAAFVVLASPANAQLYFCTRPDEPSIPLYRPESWEAEHARSEVEQYLNEMQEYLDCLKLEMDDAASEAQDVVTKWNLAVATW